jgi:DNA-binding CsgD family transcriptional regulator/tetratricopeptide (TPR) repeat protein
LTRYTMHSSGFKPSPEDITQLEQGLMIARQQGNLAEEAYSLGALALITRRHQVSEEVLTYAEQCLAIYQALGDGWGMLIGLGNICGYYLAIGEVETGLRYLRQCEDLARNLGDQFGVSLALSLLGYKTFEMTGNYAECERYWQEAYTIRRAFRAPDGIAMSAAYLSYAALLRGDRDRARGLANESLAVGSDEGWRQHARVALTTLGHIAIADEHYDEAWHLFDKSESQTEGDFPTTVFFAMTGFALACCGLHDFQAAKEHLQAALTLIEDIRASVFWTQLLPSAALILAHEGKIEQATERLGLAFSYPGSLVQMMARWPLLTNIIDALKANLGADRYAATWERGTSQDLVLVVAWILEQFGSGGDTKHVQQIHQGLVEPLSERELEVLHLIAEGLSNREIAGEMVVTVGTVKKHINNIYEKLQVSSRTQALMRARSINLLP